MTLRTLFAASLSLLLAVPALAAPTKLAQQGRVLDSTGESLEGTHAMSFSLFDAATEGSSLWTEERVATFEAGYYSITLGEQVPLDDLLFAGESVWLEISIGGEALTPRQEVVSVPYALRATAAEHVEGGMVDAEEISVDGTVVIDATGNWVGPTPAVGWGDLSGIPADIADGDQDTDTLAGLACAEGQLPKWDATASLWICGDDLDTTGSNTDILASLPCADGYIAKMDGSTGLWACAADEDSFAGLAGVCLPGDIPVLDPVSGSWACGVDNDTVTTSLAWSAITGIPADIADGDQDTVTLTLPWSSITGIPADIADGDQDTVTLTLPWSSITGIPADIADGDQDTVTLTLPWSSITGVPADITDGDQDALAALSCADGEGVSWSQSTQSWECTPEASEQDPLFAASAASGITPAQITNWTLAHGWGDHAAQGYSTSDTLASLNCASGQVPRWSGTAWGCGDDQDTDTQLTEAQVDTMVANNGYMSAASLGSLIYERAGGSGHSVVASCDPGDVAISGSCQGSSQSVNISSSYRSGSGGWVCETGTGNGTVSTSVICLDVGQAP